MAEVGVGTCERMRIAAQIMGYILAAGCAFFVSVGDYAWATWFGLCAIASWAVMVMPKDK